MAPELEFCQQYLTTWALPPGLSSTRPVKLAMARVGLTTPEKRDLHISHPSCPQKCLSLHQVRPSFCGPQARGPRAATTPPLTMQKSDQV